MPELGDTWAYRGTRHKDSQIRITYLNKFEVTYVHERRATTRLSLFHKRFKFVCTKEEEDARMAACAARVKARALLQREARRDEIRNKRK